MQMTERDYFQCRFKEGCSIFGGPCEGCDEVKDTVRISWNHDRQIWVATDESRPGCCAVDTNKTRLRKGIREAQAAYDEARSS